MAKALAVDTVLAGQVETSSEEPSLVLCFTRGHVAKLSLKAAFDRQTLKSHSGACASGDGCPLASTLRYHVRKNKKPHGDSHCV